MEKPRCGENVFPPHLPSYFATASPGVVVKIPVSGIVGERVTQYTSPLNLYKLFSYHRSCDLKCGPFTTLAVRDESKSCKVMVPGSLRGGQAEEALNSFQSILTEHLLWVSPSCKLGSQIVSS